MRVIIVDDEVTSAQVLEKLIQQNIPSIQVVAVCHKPQDALIKLSTLNPDLVFMDIELPGMTGFDILERIQNINFDVIFTTAHSQYGIKAIPQNLLIDPAGKIIAKNLRGEELDAKLGELIK